jgi:hypothetical protein
MNVDLLIQGAGLGAVVLASLWDMRTTERRARTGRAKAREVPAAQRCPFCRREFDEADERVRCASCATPHHGECWIEHGSCTLFGCGSKDLRPTRDRRAETEPAEEEGPESVTEAIPCG